jgi:ubiquinone/menaquinone biosynthesis C-methylase UbiE
MALIFHQLFPGGKVIEALAKRPGGLAANLTSKNFRDLRDAIAEAYKAGPVFEALQEKKRQLELEQKNVINLYLKGAYSNIKQVYLKQEEQGQEEKAKDEKIDDLSERIIDYKSRTSKEVVDLVISAVLSSFEFKAEEKSKEAIIMKLENYLLGNYAAQIIDIGLRAGLFRAINEAGQSGISDATLAQQLGFAPTYVEWWCKAAYAFELLECEAKDAQEGDPPVYKLDSDMATLLLKPDDLDFLGGEFLLSAALFEEFQEFPTYLYTGQVKSRSEVDARIHKFYQNLTEDDAPIITQLILDHIPEGVVKNILDIGTGAGTALIHYARHFTGAKVVGLDIDLPTVLLAQRTIAQVVRDDSQLDSQIEVRLGDARQLSEKDTYDLITMNLALHEMGVKYENVLKHVYDALTRGGVVVICEFYAAKVAAAYRNPAYQQWLSLHLHEILLGSHMFSSEELQALLESQGFQLVRTIDHPINGYLMILAQKP